MIYIEDEERDRAIDALMAEAKAIGAMVEIARGERDFRPNQYDRLAADALALCLRISTALAPRTAPNAKTSGPTADTASTPCVGGSAEADS
jgi:hypothetical protein